MLAHLLQGSGVRFHLRQLTMAWLGERPDPTDAEQHVVDDAYEDQKLRPHIVSLVYASSIPWTKRLFARGDLRKAMHGGDPSEVNTALWLMWSVRELMWR